MRSEKSAVHIFPTRSVYLLCIDSVSYTHLDVYKRQVYDTVKKIWNPKNSQTLSWEQIVKSYIDSGARIIGGCCRTSPKDIEAIHEAVQKYRPN